MRKIILHIPCAGDVQDAVLKRPCQVVSAGAAFCRVRKCRHRQQLKDQTQYQKTAQNLLFHEYPLFMFI